MRRLRLLVSALIFVLIAGVVTVAATLVIRLGAVGQPAGTLAPVTAAGIALPDGEDIVALGRGPGEIMVLTRDAAGAEHLRIFDATTGEERSVTAVARD